ncbi:hypothetical protein MRB53_007504 [Persea americana]|uniref:Uncharacterized protein n=1 Tax=Persea americana TaxID=3435 RepID=A0ACC2MK26_PERAE|nr:hypothetical protein MRB53_007504 [Persea americana]
MRNSPNTTSSTKLTAGCYLNPRLLHSKSNKRTATLDPSQPSRSSSSSRTSMRTRVRADLKPKLVSLDRVATFPTYRVGINRHKSDPHVEKSKDSISEQLGLMYDDGYGIAGVIDYLDAAKEMIRPDGGPPCWFFPIECGRPIKGSPIMLFLPALQAQKKFRNGASQYLYKEEEFLKEEVGKGLRFL